jgi:hypothetical protein
MSLPAATSPYAGYRFPAEIISQAVWLYFRFPLSLRMVEEMLAARGIIISHETVRQWACAVPGCRGAFSREQEDALWEQVFTVQPARRREFEPNSKRRKRRAAPLPNAMG